jgi:uncharacterized protein (DUF1501 family)
MPEATVSTSVFDHRRAVLFGAAAAGLMFFAGRAAASSRKDTLVVLFQRGGVDALNMIVPYGDSNYYAIRGSNAVRPPDEPGGALKLNGYFGLHPSLAPLMPVFQAGQLAAVHAAGLPLAIRSHFRAQLQLEYALDDPRSASQGWLARWMASTAGAADSPLRSVGIGVALPQSLDGAATAAAVNSASGLAISRYSGAALPELLGEVYSGEDAVGHASRQALGMIDSMARSNPGQFAPDNGAVYPTTKLGNALKLTGQLVKAGLGSEVFCIDSGGWDTHSNQATRLSIGLADLALSLSAFNADMGPRMQGITILVMSEFGRTPKFNASGGTDHGRASCMLAMGGGVNGGVYGNWPGLAATQLDPEGDLRATMDTRTILSELLATRMGGADLAQVFPGFSLPETLGMFRSV